MERTRTKPPVTTKNPAIKANIVTLVRQSGRRAFNLESNARVHTIKLSSMPAKTIENLRVILGFGCQFASVKTISKFWLRFSKSTQF